MMDVSMPLMSTFFAFMVPAVVGVYWIFRSIYQAAQTWLLNKIYPIPEITREQIQLAEEAYKSKKKKKKVITIEVDEDDDSYDEMIVSKERAEKIEAKNKKLAEEESEVDRKLEELMEKANKKENKDK
jgi:YidC/Oxa1 family membrane protein insertase